MDKIFSAVKSSKIFHLINYKLIYIFHYLNKILTPLAILVFIIAGSVLIFITSYLMRFKNPYFWLWKNYAAQKIIFFIVILIIIKFLLGLI